MSEIEFDDFFDKEWQRSVNKIRLAMLDESMSS